MKVLLVATQVDELGGGAATVVRQLADGLTRRGIDVTLVGTRRASGLEVGQHDAIRLYTFRPRNLYWIGDKDTKAAYQKMGFQLIDLWNPHVYRTVRAIVDREQPDIIHTHKLRGLSPSIWAAARAGVVRPLVHTCHDHELISPEGTLTGRLGVMAVNGSPWLWPYQAMRRALSRAVVAVTTPSRFTLERHTALGFFPEAQPFIVPNSHGLSEDELSGVQRESADRPVNESADLRLLYLGRIDGVKGTELLCRAFEIAVAERPALRLDVAGTGALLDGLRARYAHRPQLVFHGHVAGAAKRELLAAADAVVIPTIGQEVFGIVAAEAFAYGKPVLATAVGGLPEVVTDGRTGYLVEPNDVDRLAQLIGWAGDHVATLRAMRPACLAAARAYTLERVAAGYLGVYQSAQMVAASAALPLAK